MIQSGIFVRYHPLASISSQILTLIHSSIDDDVNKAQISVISAAQCTRLLVMYETSAQMVNICKYLII